MTQNTYSHSADTDLAPGPPLHAVDLGLAPYAEIQELQRRLRDMVASGHTPGVLMLLEHQPVITLGKNASLADIRDSDRARQLGVDIVRSERGGRSTLHAPGQLVAYPILRIPRRDLRTYVHQLERVVLSLLRHHNIKGSRSEGRPGVYSEARKIASIGLRCRHGVTSHGTALNVSNDLGLFGLISSCGDPSLEQTSIQAETGVDYPMADIKLEYLHAFAEVFGLRLGPLTPLHWSSVEEHLLGVTRVQPRPR